MQHNQREIAEMPLRDNASGGNVAKKYFTAEESMAFLEPRIRAMFK